VSTIATVSGADGPVASVNTAYDPATGEAINQANATSSSGAFTVTKLILKDNLSSMVAEFTVTSASAGALVVHGFGPWGNARNAASPLADGQRGFTGHEHLAELGLIHMNGRIYDPALGRFLQADPIIQAPQSAQSHNRYAYVMNNPLAYTDPSGFSWWTKWRSKMISSVVWIGTMFVTGGTCIPCANAAASATKAGMDAHARGGNVWRAIGSSIVGSTVSYFAGSIPGAFAENLANGGNVTSALKAAFSSALSEQFGAGPGGCISARLSGGSCWAGARDAMISAGIDAARGAAWSYIQGEARRDQQGRTISGLTGDDRQPAPRFENHPEMQRRAIFDDRYDDDGNRTISVPLRFLGNGATETNINTVLTSIQSRWSGSYYDSQLGRDVNLTVLAYQVTMGEILCIWVVLTIILSVTTVLAAFGIWVVAVVL
jgi:RHS repeat-associated protein